MPSIAISEADKILDCGDPEGEVCKMEREGQIRTAKAYANWEKNLKNEGAKIHAQYKAKYPSFFVAKKRLERKFFGHLS